MKKTVLILPDGRQISSGQTGTDAILSFTLTQCVNEEQELTLGSVCAAMAELTVLTSGEFAVSAGQELTVLWENENGSRQQVGVFIAEKPARPTANTVKLTAYDRVIRLDRDLTQWLAGLTQWPYTLWELSRMVCQECGVELCETQLPNGEFPVAKFTAQGVTGRQILRWVGELAGRFCRATPEGKLEFAWFTPAETALLPTGDVYYFQNGFSYEDYHTAPIERVQIRRGDGDVGTVYPDGSGEKNTYIISDNPLAAANTSLTLIGIAQTLYEQLCTVSYTPCKLKVPASLGLCPGQILTVTNRKGEQFTTYVMTRRYAGGKDALECTGSPQRSSSAAVNRLSYRALTGKLLNLQTTVDGLKVENADSAGKAASLAMDVEAIAAEVSRQQTDMGGIKTQMTALEQNAQSLDIRISTLTQEGTNKVKTQTGFTFDEQGLTISKEGTRIENLLNENGMYVKRSGEVLLKADQEGVTAVDVTVRNYLIVGDHARFEDYSSSADAKRTACFWI